MAFHYAQSVERDADDDEKRCAAEKAGVYVKSYSRSKNFELDEDIIETMTANILKLIEKPIFKMLEEVDNLEGLMIRVTVKAQINDSDITRWLNKDEQEKSALVAQMEAMRIENEEQARIIDDLKRQLANNPQDINQISQEISDADKINFISSLELNILEDNDFIKQLNFTLNEIKSGYIPTILYDKND